MLLKTQQHEGIRFLFTVLLGLIIDLGVSFLLRYLFHTPLFFSAAVGFLSGAAFNYVFHSLWTFKDSSKHSPSRVFLYIIGLGLTFLVRLLAIQAFSFIEYSQYGDVIRLVLAVGVSFMFNYLMSKVVIFGKIHNNP